MEEPYKNREIDEKFGDIMDALGRIEGQTIKHNGRLTKVEKVLWVLGTTVTVLLVSGNSAILAHLISSL